VPDWDKDIGDLQSAPKLRVIGSVNHESDRLSQDDAGVLLTLNDYTTVNAKISYTVVRDSMRS